MSEDMVIIGAGMAGLMAALALAGEGRTLTILDQDPAPPDGGFDAAFDHWERRGVSQFRQSHAFLARMLNLISDRRPALLAELLDAGARLAPFCEMIPDGLRARYQPAPGDDRLSILISRRATLEWVLRRHMERTPGVIFQNAAVVRGLKYAPSQEGDLVIAGVFGVLDGKAASWTADVVVDASGRGTRIPQWLAEAGTSMEESEEDAGIVYYTRHYRLRDGAVEPPRAAGSGTGDLGYLKFGVFNADNRWFSITLAAPEVEEDLRRTLINPDAFDKICASLPGVAQWTDPIRSEPKSRVLGMGDLRSRWRSFISAEDRPAALNLFMLGDGLIRSNPLYGRGCTFAAIEAFALADTLKDVKDPRLRPKRYQSALDQELRPFFDDMQRQDRSAIRRALRGIGPPRRPTLRSRMLKSFVEDAVGPALRSDLTTLRAALSAFHMLTPPAAWIRAPRSILTVLRTWATPRSMKADLYPKNLGPKRGMMMQILGLGG